MYDQCSRFPKLYIATPPKVGPGTYNVHGTIGKYGCSYAPFLSLQLRGLSIVNKAALYQPGPDCYYPLIKQHVKGFISMQKRPPRFVCKKSEGPGPCNYELDTRVDSSNSNATSPRSSYSGKMVRANIINRHGIPIPSIPFLRGPGGEKNSFCGYEESLDGHLVRRVPKKAPKRTETYICHGSMKLRRYKGVYFGNRTGSRDSPLFSNKEGPGPADYDVISSKPREIRLPYTGRRWSTVIYKKDEKGYIALGSRSNESPEIVMSTKEKAFPKDNHFVDDKPPLLRYLDLLLKNANRENIPAPNAYDLVKEIRSLKTERVPSKGKGNAHNLREEFRKKLPFKRRNTKHIPPSPGFMSSVPRFRIMVPEVPAPGTYDPQPTKFDLIVEEDPNSAAFLHGTPRFPKPQEFHTPGPGSYKFPGMVDEMKKRLGPRPSLPRREESQVPVFGSKVPRIVDMTLLCSKSIPGPTDYNVQDSSRKRYRNMDAVFKSKTERCITPPFMTSKHLRRSTQLRRERALLMPRGRSDVASRLTCTIPSRGDTINARDRQSASPSVTGTSVPIRRQPKPKKKARVFPFNSTGPRVGAVNIPDYPGPGKYDHAEAEKSAVLKNGYSGRMTTESRRFESLNNFPGPADYQTVKPEMNLKSFNTNIESEPRWDRIEKKTKKKRWKASFKKGNVPPSQSATNVVIEEPGIRRLVMRSSYVVLPQKRIKESIPYIPMKNLYKGTEEKEHV